MDGDVCLSLLCRLQLLPERLQITLFVQRLAEHGVEGAGQVQQADLQVEARSEGVGDPAGVPAVVGLVRRTLNQVALLDAQDKTMVESDTIRYGACRPTLRILSSRPMKSSPRWGSRYDDEDDEEEARAPLLGSVSGSLGSTFLACRSSSAATPQGRAGPGRDRGR